MGNQCFVLFAIFTKVNITGTSTKTPTIVAKATGDVAPNSAIATATDNSKKLDAPIKADGAAIQCAILNFLHDIYAIKKIRIVWIVNGIAINKICKKLLSIALP